MKHSIIIYGSQYGTSKRYAERLSAITGIRCVSRKEAKGINDYERVIYMGGLYAGSVLGSIFVGLLIIAQWELSIS